MPTKTNLQIEANKVQEEFKIPRIEAHVVQQEFENFLLKNKISIKNVKDYVYSEPKHNYSFANPHLDKHMQLFDDLLPRVKSTLYKIYNIEGKMY